MTCVIYQRGQGRPWETYTTKPERVHFAVPSYPLWASCQESLWCFCLHSVTVSSSTFTSLTLWIIWRISNKDHEIHENKKWCKMSVSSDKMSFRKYLVNSLLCSKSGQVCLSVFCRTGFLFLFPPMSMLLCANVTCNTLLHVISWCTMLNHSSWWEHDVNNKRR